MLNFTHDQLRKTAFEIFKAAGATDEEAGITSDLLVEANLAGHDSHGVLRIPQYVRMIRNGDIKPGANIEITQETPATAVINGNWGFGQLIATKAMQIAIEKAKNCSISSVSVYNCNHISRLASYALMAAECEMIAMMMVNGHGGDQSVAPFGGIARRLGTNPIAVAIPTKGEPFVLDITTSAVAGGKLRVKKARKEKLPEGWLIDSEGNPTTDPEVYFTEPPGALLPLGGALGHKGYGLSLVVDILAGALSEAGCSRANAPRLGNGIWACVINIESFTPIDEFKHRVQLLLEYVKSSPTAPGFNEIVIPGEQSFRERRKRLKEGIFIEDETWQQIMETRRSLGLE
jgi:uncharacterized oxidoreductase